VSVREAARRLRVDPKTVRDRIRAGTLQAKASGNRGRLVWVTEPPREPPREPPGEDEEPPGELIDELREALAEERIARARLEERLVAGERREGELATALAKAEARADRLEAELAAAMDAERTLVARLEAELAEARKPALVRLIEALRRRQ
jgi:excisionase family DNA binding protein